MDPAAAVDYQKKISFLYKSNIPFKSAIKTKIIKKLYPELYIDQFPELINLREAAMVDVHRVGEFQEVQRNLRFLEGKTEYGYSIKQPIRGRVMMR